MKAEPSPAPKARWLRVVNSAGPFLVLVFVTLLFASLLGASERSAFFSSDNLKTILAQTVIGGIL